MGQRFDVSGARVLSLRDMTEGSGCTPRTVRYYERQGLLRARRTAGGHRQFAECELERLNFVISLREAGWSIEEVVALLGVRAEANDDAATLSGLHTRLEDQIARIERKIQVLAQLRDDLRGCASLLPVCMKCSAQADDGRQLECAACEQVPPLPDLPRSFRLIWRARELDGGQFDELAADEDDADVHGPARVS